MKRWIFRLLLILGLAVLETSSPAAGLLLTDEFNPDRRDDRLIAPKTLPPPPRVRPSLQPIQVSRTEVDATVRNQVATTKIDQEFYNPNSIVCEGTFLFPVPKGSHLERFTLEINGKPMEAELLAGDKARKIYEDIVRQRLDPALLEYAGRDLYRVRIFPFEPGSRRAISVTYTQVLPQDQGLSTWQIPMTRLESGNANAAGSVFKLMVNLEGSQPLKTVYSPSHSVSVARDGERRAVVTAEINAQSSESDFQLMFSRSKGELGMDLLTHRLEGQDGYFMLVATPEWDTTKPTPKDLVFVLDSSGSMSGKKLEQGKRALRFCVENLHDEDRFEILRFSSEVDGAFQKLVEASRKSREQALAFIDGIRPTGGTAIHEALKQAMQLKPVASGPSRPFVVVFLTDGLPTVGTSDEKSIVNVVTGGSEAAGRDGTRVFCFGIGHDVNTHLLDRITDSTRAVSAYVLPEEDLEVKVSAFFTRIQQPALTEIEITAPEGIRWTQVHPNPFPDLFKGQQIIIAGRYRGEGKGKLTLRGRLANEMRSFASEVSFSGSESGNTFIPRLWATRRVGHLLDEIRLRGENQELKDEVTELARKFAIVTPYTAYLVQEDEVRRGVAMSQQSFRWANEPARKKDLQREYDVLLKSKSGEGAVADARSLSILKNAEGADRALQSGNYERLRGAVTPAAPPATTAPTLSAPVDAGRAALRVSGPEPSRGQIAQDSADAFQQQSRYVNGRAFFQNGSQWVDSKVQAMPQIKPVRIAFASSEYFALLEKHPEARPWFALGQNVQLVIGETVYEVYSL